MLNINFDETCDAFILQPEDTITEEDFQSLTLRVNDYINTNDAVPALIIEAPKFPGWDSFGAMTKHFKFVKDHHKLVPKIAFVSDSNALTIAPMIAKHFVKAQIQHFAPNHLEAAKLWVADRDAPAGKFEWIEGLPGDVIAISATGTITAADYEDVLIPEIDTRLKEHDKLKLLFQFDEDFEGYTLGAAWDDCRFGIMHLGDFSKIAVVTDVDWIRKSTKLFAPLMKGQIHVFSNDAVDEAKSWIKF